MLKWLGTAIPNANLVGGKPSLRWTNHIGHDRFHDRHVFLTNCVTIPHTEDLEGEYARHQPTLEKRLQAYLRDRAKSN